MSDEARIVWTGDVSHDSFGSLTLGMSREAVRELFAGSFRTFARGGYGLDLDQFLGRGIMVTFEDDRSVFVELASPSQPSYQGVELLERQVRDVVLDLTHQGHVVVQLDSGRYDIVGPPWVGLYVEFDVVKGVSFGDRSRG